MRRSIIAAAVALVVLSGCSSDDKNQAASGSTTTVAGAPTGTGPTSTVRPVDTSFTGANSAQFCALAKTYNDKFKNVTGATTAAQLRAVTQDGRTAINQAVAAAPAEIKPDAQVLADAFGTLFTELDKVNFDASKIPVAAFAPLQTPQFAQATTRFQAYLRTVCGVTG